MRLGGARQPCMLDGVGGLALVLCCCGWMVFAAWHTTCTLGVQGVALFCCLRNRQACDVGRGGSKQGASVQCCWVCLKRCVSREEGERAKGVTYCVLRVVSR